MDLKKIEKRLLDFAENGVNPTYRTRTGRVIFLKLTPMVRLGNRTYRQMKVSFYFSDSL